MPNTFLYLAPSVPSSPLLPKPFMTRPSGSTPWPSRVRPLWFSKPTTVPKAVSNVKLPIMRSAAPTVARSSAPIKRQRSPEAVS